MAEGNNIGKGKTMSQEAVVGSMPVHDFEHHATITLPDGRMFQVPRHAVSGSEGEGFVLQDDAEIKNFWDKREPELKLAISVPASVLARLPA